MSSNGWFMAAAVAGLGGVGAVLRFWLSRWSGWLPHGILVGNSAASFVAGLLLSQAEPLATLVVIGLCGGLSTFSSFAAATVEFWRSGKRAQAIANTTLNLVVPSTAAWLGVLLAGILLK